MKKKIITALMLSAITMFALLAFTACDDADDADDVVETEAAVETTAETTAAPEPAPAVTAENYGYAGDDPVEAAVYEYMVDEVSEQYTGDDDDNVVSVPVVKVVDRVENEDGSVDVGGEFQIYNYAIEGDTLKCVSGGSHPGKMHVVKDVDNDGDDDDADDANDNDYEVASFEPVGDGGNFEPTAKKIFGDKYDAFMEAQSNDEELTKLRGETLAVYVKATGLQVTKYQDEGWDPVELPL